MKLIFELGAPGRRCAALPEPSFPSEPLSEKFQRKSALGLPEVSEVELVRHYMEYSRNAFGVDNGFYPLGSCTMKYNPKLNDELASLPGFADIHPLQPAHTAQGCLRAMALLQTYLCEITGMDAVSLQPAAGAHGEYTGLQLIRAYHLSRGDTKRTKVIVPDSAHGTNPASAVMNGFSVVNIPSLPNGLVDLDALRAAADDETAAFMLTNPNTVGLFDTSIKEIADIVHDAGGLLYYDGANLNAVMGLVRPGDTGFDVIHLNLHKTFATPHGGGGPGCGPVGCKTFLEPFLPAPILEEENGRYSLSYDRPQSIGAVKAFYGNFAVALRALCYILSLGGDGLREASENAVLNANYMMHHLREHYHVPFDTHCMHEFVISLEHEKSAYGVSAMDIAKALIDHGIHPPTMYFPLIVHEALMIEPTETESRETLDQAIQVFQALIELAKTDPEKLRQAPHTTPIGRPDETKAARTPILKFID